MVLRKDFTGLICACGIGAALVLSMPGAAMAQRWHYGPGLSPRDVVEDLRDEGFRRISPPVLNRDAYVLDAIDPYDTPVRLIVSAYDGRILAVHRQRDAGWQRGGRPLPPVDDLDDSEPIFSSPPSSPRRPARQATVPAPKTEPSRASNPALTPKTPTVVKTSPLAIPKDREAKGDKSGDKGSVAAMPGSKTAPRIIPMTPAAAVPPKGAASGATPAPKAAAPAAGTTPSPTLAPTPPMVPPAALE